MKRWGTWLTALAFATATNALAPERAQAQPGFLPPPGLAPPGAPFTPGMPMPTGPFTPPLPTPFSGGPRAGEPTPLGPSMFGGGDSEESLARPTAGPGVAPPSEMLQLQNGPNSFDDERTLASVEGPIFSSFTVDFLFLKSDFDRNPAYFSRSSANAPFNSTDFDMQRVFTPRLTLDLHFGPYWGVRSSWMQWDRSAHTLSVINADPNATFVSAPTISGTVAVTQNDRFVNGAATIANNTSKFNETGPLQVLSPRPYWFFNILPTQSLLGVPTPLPPFPFRNAVATGFPDSLAFASSMRTQIIDLEATRTIELNSLSGALGLGVRYGYVAHSYVANRSNVGGRAQLGPYDPFIPVPPPIDADILVGEDRETLSYYQNFGGAGPKLSLDLGTPVGPFARLYAKTNGSVLMGNRKEIAYYEALQVAAVTDRDQAPPATLFYTRTVPFQQAAHRSEFTVVPLAEAEAGLEITFGNGAIFPVFRISAFGQAWFNGGSATDPNANLFIYGVNATLGIGF